MLSHLQPAKNLSFAALYLSSFLSLCLIFRCFSLLLTVFPSDPIGPRDPGGPISVRLLIGQPWEHLVRMEAA